MYFGRYFENFINSALSFILFSSAISERLGFSDPNEDISIEKFSVSGTTTTNGSCRLEFRNGYGGVHKPNNNLFHRNGTTKLNGLNNHTGSTATKTENGIASRNYLESINLNGGNNCLTTTLTNLNLKPSSTSQPDNTPIVNGSTPSPVQSSKPSVLPLLKSTQWTPPPSSAAQTVSLFVSTIFMQILEIIMQFQS